ncbi:MAG: hypothetical protein ACR2NR_02720 [Solirubrobacteraceae bacterium]
MLDVRVHVFPAARWAVIKDARRRQHRRQRRILAMAAVLLAAAVSGGLIANSQDAGRPLGAGSAAVGAVQRVALGGRVTDATTLHGDVWALTCARQCGSVLAGHGGSGELTELNAATARVIGRAAVNDPGVLTSGNGQIWLAHFATGTVTRVNPQTGQTTATIQLELPTAIVPGDRRFLPSGISFAAGTVWVTTARGWTAAIDPRSAKVDRMIRSSSQATSVTTSGGLTWVADELYGVDTFTAHSTHVTRHRITWAGQPLSIETVAQGAGLIWALGSRTDGHALTTGTVVTAIKPKAGHVARQWPVPGGATMIVNNRGAYVAPLNGGQIEHLTATHGIQTIPAPEFRKLTTATPHALWATTRDGNLVRIALTR